MAKQKKKEDGIAESFLGELPVLGKFFKELAKTETFKERFKEVNEQIEDNLKKGHKKRWNFEANISVRPLIREVKKDASEIKIGEDYFYGVKHDKLVLAVKVPKEDVDLKLQGKNLLVKSDNFQKKIELPDYFRNIKKRQYKKGIWVLELTK